MSKTTFARKLIASAICAIFVLGSVPAMGAGKTVEGFKLNG